MRVTPGEKCSAGDKPRNVAVCLFAPDRDAAAVEDARKEPASSAPLPGRLDGLIFGMGDVLYDTTAWQRWLLQLLSRIGLHTHYRAFCRVWRRDYLVEVYRGRRDYWEALSAMLTSVGLSPAQIDEVVAAGHARRREFVAGIRPFPGVPATLAQLRKLGLSLGVLSNSSRSAKGLAEKLDRLGLREPFRAVLSSSDLGCVKPEPACYQAALRALDLPADHVAMVGHEAAELAGAAAAGMKTIAFNYDEDARADVYVGRFDQLLEVVPCGRDRLLAG